MLYDKLKMYSESGVYPFHMPGHKRNPMLCDGIMPYEIDLTEIDGFDNLHNAESCILEVQNLAEKLYNVKKAFLLVNGATGGILSAVRAMTDRGDKVIVARNSHKSVYNALELCGLTPKYIVPKVDKEFGINCSITPLQAEKAIRENPDAKLLIITSPTYEGAVSDIKEISRIAHLHNVSVLVDEAHGAHFPFSDSFPVEAIQCGADVAVASLHKTLPSLTQTALLLTSNEELINPLVENLAIFETSSPSYVFMSSIEKCLDFCKNTKAFDEYIIRLNSFDEKCRELKNIKVLCCGNDNIKNHNFFDFDISKIYKSNQRSDTQTLGTVGFAAPEQFGMQQSDARTDLYSLAVLLNVLLTGEHPSVKMCENKKILKVIKKCLSINPDDRYSTAEELYNVLNKIRRKLKYEKMS